MIDRERLNNRRMYGQTDRDRKNDRQTHRKTDRDRINGRQTYRQTDVQTDRQGQDLDRKKKKDKKQTNVYVHD